MAIQWCCARCGMIAGDEQGEAAVKALHATIAAQIELMSDCLEFISEESENRRRSFNMPDGSPVEPEHSEYVKPAEDLVARIGVAIESAQKSNGGS